MDLWSQKGFPHKGWIYVDVEDTGELSATCEMCGNNIRYVHYLSHPICDKSIGVGCVCAEKLTDDYITPKTREKAIKPTPKKQIQNWIENGWKIAQNGGVYKRISHLVLIIKQFDKYFSVLIKSNYKIEEQCKAYNYETEEDAKIASFDIKKKIIQQRKSI